MYLSAVPFEEVGFDPAPGNDPIIGNVKDFLSSVPMVLAIWPALFTGFHLFFAIVGSFTLTVGGIGVANIMYVVVRERTREIGIKRSVGARRLDILRQFFLEAEIACALPEPRPADAG